MIVSLVLASEYHANFRTSLIRSALRVDTAFWYESVESFYQHLLAEMEALATGTATSAASSPTSPSAPPRVKEMRTGNRTGDRNRSGESPTSVPTSLTTGKNPEKTEKRASTACRYFGKTNKGCTRGSKCPFKHTWDGLEKRERCLECGGKGHQARECPTKVTRSQEAVPKVPPPRHPSSTSSTSPTTMTSTSTARVVRVDEAKNEIQEIPSCSLSQAPPRCLHRS